MNKQGRVYVLQFLFTNACGEPSWLGSTATKDKAHAKSVVAFLNKLGTGPYRMVPKDRSEVKDPEKNVLRPRGHFNRRARRLAALESARA